MKLFEVDENKQLIPVTAVLCRAEKTPVGILSAVDDFRFKNISNDTDEISFKVYSKINGEPAPLYDELADFKLIFIPEWQKYYQIEVSETEQDGVCAKSITGIHLSEAELGNLMLYHLEINTEADIARDDYDPLHPSVLFDGTPNCLLNRVLADKAPHYSVGYVSPSIARLVRSFSIDNQSIHNFLSGTLAEEIGCVVEYDSVNNKINLYDTYRHCTDCGCRFDSAASACPECGSLNVSDDYGNDTGILLSTDNLAEELQFDTDKDSLKTCFKISGGDELMNAAVRSVTPTAGDTIYCFSDEFYQDMPNDLSLKLKEYHALCNSKKDAYCTLSEKIYDCMDKIALYETSMMPSQSSESTGAANELAKLTSSNIGTVGVHFTLNTNTSKTLLDNAVLGVAKLFISAAYKIDIISSSCVYNQAANLTTWSGRFRVYHAVNSGDTAEHAASNPLTVTIDNNFLTFVEQKLNKSLLRDGAYNIDTDWNKYALSFLKTYALAYQSCLDILKAQKDTTPLNNEGIYNTLLQRYQNPLDAIHSVIKIREGQIAALTTELSGYEKSRETIAAELNLKTVLGETLWKKFCSYRRDGEYNNSNYTSDGLSYTELLERAKELVNAAVSELYRASQTTFTITGTIANFLLMPEFEPFQRDCQIGNWLYIQQSDNGSVYRLRLNGISGSYSSPEHIELTFSNAVRINNVIHKLSDTIQKASSIANNFSYVAHQASQGEAAKQNMEQWVSDGLNSALVRIKNNENEEVIFDKNGILAREYDDIQDEYSPEQLKITHNILAFTNDNWKTSTLALGNHEYKTFKNNDFVTESGYGLTSQFVTSAQINGSQMIGGQIYSSNYKPKGSNQNGKGTFINLEEGSFSFAGGNLTYDGNTLKITNNDNGTSIDGSCIAAGTISSEQIKAGSITAEQIKAGSITADQIKAGSITTDQIDAESLEVGVTSIARDMISTAEVSAQKMTIFDGGEGIHINSDAIYTHGYDDDENNIPLVGFRFTREGKIFATQAIIAQCHFGTNGFMDPSGKTQIVKDGSLDSYRDGFDHKATIKDGDISFFKLNTDDEEKPYWARIGGIAWYGINLPYGGITAESFTQSSDERLKNSISCLDSQSPYLALAQNLHPISFQFNSDSDEIENVGFSAQDIIKACRKLNIDPEKTSFVKQNEMTGYYSVNYSQINSLSFLWLKNLEERVKSLEKQISKILIQNQEVQHDTE